MAPQVEPTFLRGGEYCGAGPEKGALQRQSFGQEKEQFTGADEEAGLEGKRN